jgi:excisionase family DNA binding protein
LEDALSDYRIKRVYRRKEAAEQLSICTKTLDRMIARGEIAVVAITDRLRGITNEEIDRHIKARTVGAA